MLNSKQVQSKGLIIGHTGRMGSFLFHHLSKTLPDMRGLDMPLTQESMVSACRDVDFILFCIPAFALEETLCVLAPHLPAHAIIADITSVKVQPMDDMQKHWPGVVIGTHPLFGPTPSKGSPMPVAIVAGTKAEEEHLCFIENLFLGIGCAPFRCTAQKHDHAMASIQNLNFITSLAYFAALAPLAEDDEILPFLTPSFRRRQDAAQRMLTEDAQLFTGLFKANPHSHELVRKYRSYLNVAAGGDIELLAERAKWWWT